MEHAPDGRTVTQVSYTRLRLPSREAPIDLPSFVHGWPVEHVGFSRRVVDALRHKGVVILGDLAGRKWGFIYVLKDVSTNSAYEVVARLHAVAEGLLGPPPAGPTPQAVALPNSPGLLLAWLLKATRPRQIEIALRYLVDRPTQAELGRELKLTGSRVSSLVAVGKHKAKLHLAEVPGWRTIVEAAGEVLDALAVVSAHGLYEALARRLGWGPASVGEVCALCGLLALHSEVVVLRRGEVMAVGRSEKDFRARLEFLSRADDQVIEEVRCGLPPHLRDVFERDRIPLLMLAGYQQ